MPPRVVLAMVAIVVVGVVMVVRKRFVWEIPQCTFGKGVPKLIAMFVFGSKRNRATCPITKNDRPEGHHLAVHCSSQDQCTKDMPLPRVCIVEMSLCKFR